MQVTGVQTGSSDLEYLAKIQKLIYEHDDSNGDEEADNEAAQELTKVAEEYAGQAVETDGVLMVIMNNFDGLTV